MRLYLLIFLFFVAFCNGLVDKIGPRGWLRVLNEAEVEFVRRRCNPQARLSTPSGTGTTKPTGKPTIDVASNTTTGRTGKVTIDVTSNTTTKPTGKPTIDVTSNPATGRSGSSTEPSSRPNPSTTTVPLPDILPVSMSNKDQVQQRVGGGDASRPGDFKHAVVFVRKPNQEVHREKEETLCSGTLISPWHVLTARHCWENKGKNTPGSEGHLLKYGGVCYAEGDECKQADMKTAELDFVIFDWDPEKGLRGDLAIAQLKEPIAPGYFDNGTVDIACLPQIKEATLPDEFQIAGWGNVMKNKEEVKTTRLHNVTLKTRIDCFGFDPINFGFCGAVDSEDEEKQGAGLPGDSGGGAVTFSEVLGRYVVIGVQTTLIKNANLTAPIVKKPRRQTFTKMISTSNYVDDMCQYLKLCGDKAYGYFPVLQMGSVYLQNATRRESLSNIGPFRMINYAENYGINRMCQNYRQIIVMYTNGSINPADNEKEKIHTSTSIDPNSVGKDHDLVPPKDDSTCWGTENIGPSTYSFELVSNNTAYCALTAMTSLHLVSSRDCVQNAIKSVVALRKDVSLLASKIINVPWHVRLASEDDEEVESRADDKKGDKKKAEMLMPVDLIAWSSQAYGLSIVQLANPIALGHIACLQHTEEVLPQIDVAKIPEKKNPLLSIPRFFFDLFGSDDTNLKVAATEEDLDETNFPYGVFKMCNDTEKYLCAKKSTRKVPECLKNQGLKKPTKKPAKKRLDGHGIYDLYRYAFVGIQQANDELKKASWEMYLAAKAFSGTLCIFLNRCEFESHTFNSAVDYFNNIYKFN